jgi:galactokinase
VVRKARIGSGAFASAYAPGRVELLGNHTDYNEGLVLAAAIDRGIKVSRSRRDGELIQIRSAEFGRAEAKISALQPHAEHR